MAIRTNTVNNANFLTAIGGTLNSADTINLISGNTSYTTGADFSSGAKDITALYAGPGWSGNIDDTTLKVDADQTSTGVIDLAWAGDIFRIAGGNTSTINRIVCRPINNGKVIVSDCSTLNEVDVRSGYMVIQDGADADAVTVQGGQCTLLSSSDAAVTVNALAGVTELQRDVGTLNVGSLCILSDVLCAPTAVNVHAGTLRLLDAGTLSALYGWPGTVIDASQITRSITASAGTLSKGCRVILPKSGFTFDISGLTDHGAIIQ